MWIRIRAVVVEDEPLAAEYLATLLDDTYQVEVIATATDSETGRQLGFTACGCATDSELKSQLRARAPPGWRQCLNYKTLKGRQRLNRVGLAKRKIGVRLDSIAVTVRQLVIGHPVAHMVLRIWRQPGRRLRQLGQKRVGPSKNSAYSHLGILEDTSIYE
jgi:hypothetical protein